MASLELKLLWHNLSRFLYVLYLFTANDFVSVLYPATLFAIFSCLSGTLLTTNPHPTLFSTVCRLPQILLWIWLNLLVLCLANQRLPDSIAEDAANKPWRPLPSRQMTATQARRVLIGAIAVTYSASWCLGGIRETLALFVFNWIYNDLEAANEHYAVRNLMNALGITCIGAGAARVGCAPGHDVSSNSWQWWLIISMVLLTTIQAQDLYDQEGDAKRGRSTVPLVLGDTVARWTVAVPVMCWSVAVTAFWGGGGATAYFVVPMALGYLVAGRILVFRNVCADRLTFKAWAVWIISLYALPLVKAS